VAGRRASIAVSEPTGRRNGEAACRKRKRTAHEGKRTAHEGDALTYLCATSNFENYGRTKTQFEGKDRSGNVFTVTYDWVRENYGKAFVNSLYYQLDHFIKIPVGKALEVGVLAGKGGSSAVPLSSGSARSGIGASGPVEYQQGAYNYCLPCAGGNALHEYGDHDAGDVVAATKDELSDFKELGNFIDAHVKGWTVVPCGKFYPNAVADPKREGLMDFIMRDPPVYPVVVQILDDRNGDAHCCAIVNGRVYDSNASMSMPLCKESLDICAGKGHTCKGFSRAIMLEPTPKKRKSLLRKI